MCCTDSKKYPLLYISIVVYIFSQSCNVSEVNNFPNISITDTLSIDIDNLSINTLKRSSNFVDHRIIKLELSDKSLIGELSKLVCDKDSNFYILDEISKAIFKFDYKGKFLFRINSIGNGPGEYLRIRDICLADSAVVILTGKRILNFYSCLTGEFIKEVPLPSSLFPKGFSYVGNSIFAFSQSCDVSSMPEYRLVLFNSRTNQIIESLYKTDIVQNYFQEFYFYTNNNKVYFSLPLTTYVLNISAINSGTTNLFFNFGRHNFPLSYDDNNNIFDLKILTKKDCVTWVDNVIEAGDIISFRYGYGRYVYTGWYSKKNKITYATSFDKGKLIILYEAPKAAIGEYLIGAIKPITLVDISRSVDEFGEQLKNKYQDQLSELPDNFDEILKNCTANDNPYLLLYKVKI